MTKVKGVVEEIEAIEQLKEGTKKTGQRWTLWGTKLKVSGNLYGLTAFSKTELEDKLKLVALRDEVEFESEENQGYLNVKKDAAITVLRSGVPTEPKEEGETIKPERTYVRTDTDASNDLAECIESVIKALQKKEIVKEIPFTKWLTEDIRCMALSLFIDKQKDRKVDNWKK